MIPAMAMAADRASIQRYSTVAIILHWAIALLIIGNLAGGAIMTRMGFSTLKFEIYQWHKSFGIAVLLLSLARLGWRLTHTPPPEPVMPAWQARAAKVTHVGLYVLMIGLPLTGWALVSASTLGIETKLFYVIPWPHLPLPATEATESATTLAHEILGKLTFALVVLHIAAALKHHFKDKDGLIWRMLP